MEPEAGTSRPKGKVNIMLTDHQHLVLKANRLNELRVARKSAISAGMASSQPQRCSRRIVISAQPISWGA